MSGGWPLAIPVAERCPHLGIRSGRIRDVSPIIQQDPARLTPHRCVGAPLFLRGQFHFRRVWLKAGLGRLFACLEQVTDVLGAACYEDPAQDPICPGVSTAL